MLTLIRPFLPYIIAAVFGLAATGGVYWYIREQGVAAERARQREAELYAFIVQLEKSQKIAKGLEAEIANLRKMNDNLQRELQNETATDAVYRECKLPAGGVRILQEALAAAKPTR